MNITDLRVAWIADIYDKVSGIYTDTLEMHQQAINHNVAWFPITSLPEDLQPFKNFKPLLNFPLDIFYKNSFLCLPNIWSIIKYLKENNINVIISNTPVTMGLISMIAAGYLHIPWVDIYHTDIDFYANRLIHKSIQPITNRATLTYLKLYQKQADLIFVRTKEFYQIMLDRGYPEAKIKMYQGGVNSEKYNPSYKDMNIWSHFGIDSNKKIILFVGRITNMKDIHLLLDAYNKYKWENTELVLVGDGPEYKTYYTKYTSTLKNVHFLGTQTGEVLQKIYASANLYILPSSSETLGKTVLEAMSSGLPVIVSNKGGPQDYVQDGITGKIFATGNMESLANTLNDCINNKYNLKQMGDDARKFIMQYSEVKLFKSLSNELLQLVSTYKK